MKEITSYATYVDDLVYQYKKSRKDIAKALSDDQKLIDEGLLVHSCATESACKNKEPVRAKYDF